MRFSWDPEKERVNKRKHRTAFAEACYAFADRYMLTLFDEEHSDDEERWITMGQIPDGRVLVVSHTHRKSRGKEIVRLISARKATKKEAAQYYERRRLA